VYKRQKLIDSIFSSGSGRSGGSSFSASGSAPVYASPITANQIDEGMDILPGSMVYTTPVDPAEFGYVEEYFPEDYGLDYT
jgi:hypothetical protein